MKSAGLVVRVVLATGIGLAAPLLDYLLLPWLGLLVPAPTAVIVGIATALLSKSKAECLKLTGWTILIGAALPVIIGALTPEKHPDLVLFIPQSVALGFIALVYLVVSTPVAFIAAAVCFNYRMRPLRCKQCGLDMTGMFAGRCPACGGLKG